MIDKVASALHLSDTFGYFAWNYLRAFLWIAATAFALSRGTSARIARAFIGAHLVALGAGALTDFFLVVYAPKSWQSMDVLEWVFTAPIAIFTIISLWIGNREKEIVVPDVFMTLLPVVMWAFLVIYGWQKHMWASHVLGAWFVSAASGGVDLYVRAGPEWAGRRSYLTRLAGYVLVVMTVYLVVPRTE
jgi:hypothetical protein